MRLTILVPLVFLAAPASADFLGQDILAEWLFPGTNDVLESHIVTVGAGVELPAAAILSDSKFEIDITENTIQFNFNSAGAWQNTQANGWRFTDVNGTIAEITGYSIGATSAVFNVMNGLREQRKHC